jgi:hypothetical protein
MKTISIRALGLMLFAPVASVQAVTLTLVGSEAALPWSLVDDFEGLSYYGATGVAGVTPVTAPLSVLGGLGTLSLSPSSGDLVVYGNPPVGAGPGAGSGVPSSSADFPGFELNGGYAATAQGSAKALGVDGLDSSVTIDFSQAVDSFAFYGAAHMSAMFSVSLFDTGGSLIDVAQDIPNSTSALGFWGWESPVGIGSVKITGDYLAFDRLLVKGMGLDQFSPPPSPPAVPEVAVVAPVMGAVLVGFELLRRRRR